MKKVHITTLGCSKNLVDSEVLMGQLEINQFLITDQPEEADVVIVNTCGFIQDAKEESIQAVLEAVKLKETQPGKKVFIAGCLSQRYKAEIEKEIPEADAVFGTEDYTNILKALGKKHSAADNLYRMRKMSAPNHYAYLKISEGCNHTCSFCAIPSIRGRHRSRSIESIVEEAVKLSDNGAKELILISQDTSYYGKDLYGKQRIVDLLEALQTLKGIEWIRPLYWYPANFPAEVVGLMKNGGKIVPYLDMPIQHISANMLKRMRRGDTRASLINLFKEFRQTIPEIALRTTLILGHPGEMDSDFAELYNFIKHIEFDRLGTFIFSDEEGTESYKDIDKVDRETATDRQEQIMELQRLISLKKNKALIGKNIKVLIDEKLPDSLTLTGRTYRDAPEVDNEVLITVDESHNLAAPGDFVTVQISDASEYELYGYIIK